MSRRLKTEYYPPSHVPGPLPATAESIQQWMKAEGERPSAYFALGCVYLRDGRLTDAVGAFQEVLRLDPQDAEARSNLALCFVHLGREEEAILQLKQAILTRPELALAHLQLARLQAERGEVDAAILSLERVLRINDDSAPALTLLAQLTERAGDLVKAETLYRRSFECDSQQSLVRNRLAQFCFERGRTVFEEGKLDEAFDLWSEGYQRYSAAFHEKQEIVTGMQELARQIKEEKRLDELTAAIKTAAEEERPLAFYRAVSLLCFSLHLFPQCYCRPERVPSELAYWREQEEGEDQVLPYPRFRQGVLLALQGNIEEALDQLRFCQDHLPRSKQQSLRLKELLAGLAAIGGIELESRGTGSSSAGPEEWERAGFADPFQQQAWGRTGLRPQEASEWRKAGFTAQQAQNWAPHLPPETAAVWAGAGFTEPREVVRWRKGGFEPDGAREWSTHFPGGVDKAVQSRQAGFSDPAEAAAWLTHFTFAWEASNWRDLGFTPAEASRYLAEGVRDPFDAQKHREIDRLLGDDPPSEDPQ